MSAEDDLKAFIAGIPGFENKGHADKVRMFAWLQHSLRKRERFGTADINSCYDTLSYQPGNTSQYLPPSLFPIAEDSAGNLICLGIDPSNQDKVFFWNHEEELDEEGDIRQDYSNVYEVAPDIDQFLSNLLTGD